MTLYDKKRPVHYSEVKESEDWDEDWEILSDEGFVPLKKAMKTVFYVVWELRTENCFLRCADEHIVFCPSGERFVKDLQPGEYIQTESGYERVVSVTETTELEEMYDVEVESDSHKFVSSGIISKNSTTVISYLLWYVLFNENKRAAILANKGATARQLLGRLQLAYYNVPKFLQQGVVVWNKGSIELENGSSIIAVATSTDSIRGDSINLLIVDECAFIDHFEEFWASTYPTISSGSSSKVVLISTFNGENDFYRKWTDAIEGRSTFYPTRVDYHEVPGRTEEWAQKIESDIGKEAFDQEYRNIPQSSENALISGHGMSLMKKAHKEPLESSDILRIYERPDPERQYFATVDPADIGTDYSVISVMDVTAVPYKMVAVYRNAKIGNMGLPDVIFDLCTKYNTCPVLVENNDIGKNVLYILNYTLEYDNIVRTRRPKLVASASMPAVELGLRQTMKTKKVGCQRLKTYIETGKLVIPDSWAYEEFVSFREYNGTYKGADGKHDDIVMSLVTFSYFTSTHSFRIQFPTVLEDTVRKELKKVSDEEMMILPVFARYDDPDGMSEEDRKWLLS
jgi:hypothetical protein